MHELHAILRALGLEPASVIEFDTSVWDTTRAGADVVVIAQTTTGKEAATLKSKNMGTIRRMALRVLVCTLAEMVGFCIVCGKRLVQDSAATTAAAVALLHCPDLMEEQGTRKVTASKGQGGVIYELGGSHWLNPQQRGISGITCLKDEIGKGHLGHSLCNTLLDTSKGRGKQLWHNTATDHLSAHFAELVRRSTHGFVGAGPTLEAHRASCRM